MYLPYQQHSQFKKLKVIDKLIEQEITRSLSESIDFQKILMNFMKEGVLILTSQLKLFYLNLKARQICKKIGKNADYSEEVPTVLANLLLQFSQQGIYDNKILITEYQLSAEQNIRIRACKLPENWQNGFREIEDNHPHLLIFLEDLSVNLQEDLKIEQQKYNLTDREVEIWQLLLRAYSYQDIAKLFQISLNTVKFHVKNIYSKKRGFLENEQIIYFDHLP
jgi:ATP/maltotriose-dependent transcriptional regulator MalT